METAQLFNWEALSAMGGASLLTYFVVAYSKTLLKRLPTDILAVIIAWVILTLAQLASGASAMDWRLYALSFANAFLVAAAAGQMQNKALSPPGTAKEANKSDENRLL
ncbi:hypothetical protein [Paenibacillus kobensis]|uniref:hypothetical protein n=1 Tax=Paenibacillus kobensis TaxID=59841 RepID=UPI000FD8E1C6|nr:hypothetical protein [Paenibacillus kobensis]